jgi:hypothetical protein
MYSCRKFPSGLYRLVKWDNDYNIVAIYEIFNDKCECFQGMKKGTCRHTEEIIPEFERLDRVNSGWFYDYDNDQWDEPIAVMGLDDPAETLNTIRRFVGD